jgi:hypothetical protein
VNETGGCCDENIGKIDPIEGNVLPRSCPN